MIAIKTGRSWLELIHYGRVLYFVLAITSTAVCSKVLFGTIPWQSTLIVGLGTFVIYSVDNILDWPGEQHLLEAIHPFWKPYFIGCMIAIPLSLVTVIILSLNQSLVFLAALLGLGGISVAQVTLTRQLYARSRSLIFLWAERLIDSITWPLVLVFVPLLYLGQSIAPQTLMTIAYAWHLSWVNVLTWDLTRSATGGREHGTPILSPLIGEARSILSLRIISISAIILATIDVLLGYFPWYNITVILAPALNLIMFNFWPLFRSKSRFYGSLFPITNIISNFLVITAYYSAEIFLFHLN